MNYKVYCDAYWDHPEETKMSVLKSNLNESALLNMYKTGDHTNPVKHFTLIISYISYRLATDCAPHLLCIAALEHVKLVPLFCGSMN